MPMNEDEIVAMITAGLPGASVEMMDLAGDGDHYRAIVTWDGFAGKSRVAQHQAVYSALQGKMGGALHALSLETKLPLP